MPLCGGRFLNLLHKVPGQEPLASRVKGLNKMVEATLNWYATL